MNPDPARELLRHTLATLAYRAAKALRDVPDGFETFSAGGGTRAAGEILAHLCDLMDWGCALASGEHRWRNSPVEDWEGMRARFFVATTRLDTLLAGTQPLGYPAERLFQGPVADALTHVGQIALLRRLAGAPVRGENYFKAFIAAGQAGADQPASRVEFD